MSETYKLYGMAASLYTAKARSYLRKQGIDFKEYGVNSDHYSQQLLPVLGRFIMPAIETPNGEVIQDSSDIIEYFERKNSTHNPAYPTSTVLQVISYLFELFGGEGLLRPAMHYRWNFDTQNLQYLKNEFVAGLAPPNADEETENSLFGFASNRMRKACQGFGVSEQSAALIEASYKEFLDLFSHHLKKFPYLLGHQPTLGDYALMGPLYAHLYRDPVPGMLMRQHAPIVARWVERMNTTEDCWVEHMESNSPLIDPACLPPTLKALMRYIAIEYLPELKAHIQFANSWLDQHTTLKAGTNGMDNPTARTIGQAEFTWRGIRLKTHVLPYRFYLLQRLQECYQRANQKEQDAIKSLFTEVGIDSLLTLTTSRKVERHQFLEVWGDLRAIKETPEIS
ncbi:glutathione S-transferase [Microbulbifer sp. VTAC004]|uniref:glutathione S-transferase n=1 Tax=unclassified Microbulbifer TaxID=2619833 RepID=UPI00403A502E